MVTRVRFLFVSLLLIVVQVHAQEEVIRKNLKDRFDSLPPIEEVSKTPVPGIYEVRINQSQIIYVDEKADFLFEGELIDARNQENLTAKRVAELSFVAFKNLPFKDSFAIKRGNGSRQLAVFVDPNCGYCRKFEQELQKINNLTVHIFLYPILGADSVEKSSGIWCSKNKGRAFEDYMLNRREPKVAKCNVGAIDRNIAFGQRMNITGTPTMVFSDGERVSGAGNAEQIEQRLSEVAGRK